MSSQNALLPQLPGRPKKKQIAPESLDDFGDSVRYFEGDDDGGDGVCGWFQSHKDVLTPLFCTVLYLIWGYLLASMRDEKAPAEAVYSATQVLFLCDTMDLPFPRMADSKTLGSDWRFSRNFWLIHNCFYILIGCSLVATHLGNIIDFIVSGLQKAATNSKINKYMSKSRKLRENRTMEDVNDTSNIFNKGHFTHMLYATVLYVGSIVVFAYFQYRYGRCSCDKDIIDAEVHHSVAHIPLDEEKCVDLYDGIGRMGQSQCEQYGGRVFSFKELLYFAMMNSTTNPSDTWSPPNHYSSYCASLLSFITIPACMCFSIVIISMFMGRDWTDDVKIDPSLLNLIGHTKQGQIGKYEFLGFFFVGLGIVDDDEILSLETFFNEVDVDGNGYVSEADMKQLQQNSEAAQK